MFTKEESKKIRQEFWTTFGQKHPHKWLLYNTKIKEVILKFTFTTKYALVSIDISSKDNLTQEYYYDKFLSLKSIIISELKDIVFDNAYELENGKIISRIFIKLPNVSIHNKNSWDETMEFLKDAMLPVSYTHLTLPTKA